MAAPALVSYGPGELRRCDVGACINPGEPPGTVRQSKTLTWRHYDEEPKGSRDICAIYNTNYFSVRGSVGTQITTWSNGITGAIATTRKTQGWKTN